MGKYSLIQGDCLDILPTLPAESVQCVVTSPPYYGLRDYGTAKWEGGDPECQHKVRLNDGQNKSTLGGTSRDTQGHQQEGYKDYCHRCGAHRIDNQIGLEQSPEEYIEKLVSVFREIKRMLRNDGTVWLNLGDSYASAWASGRRSVIGNPSRTNRRINISDGLKEKDLIGIPWRVAFALQADGWWLRSDIIWHKPNPMPESVTDRPTKSHEYVFLLTKSAKYYYDAEAVREGVSGNAHAQGNGYGNKVSEPGSGIKSNSSFMSAVHNTTKDDLPTSRNFRSVWTITTQSYNGAHFATYPEKLVEPCIKAGTSERGCCSICGNPWERVIEKGEPVLNAWSTKGPGNYNMKEGKPDAIDYEGGSTLKHSRINITLGWRPNCEHYPRVNEWREYIVPKPGKDLIRAEKRENEIIGQLRHELLEFWHPMENVPCIVLDPFCGSGTTGKVAIKLGRDFIGIELNLDYIELAKKRIKEAVLPMFEL